MAKRFNSIDSLRGIAILLMFMQHFPLWMIENPVESQFYASMYILSRLSAPLFLFIAGICLILSKEKRKSQGQSERTILKHILNRGIYLIAIGFMLNMTIFQGHLIILHTIGISIILSSILLIFSIKADIIFLIGLTSLSIFADSTGLIRVLYKLFNYPPIPWIVFAIFGISTGRLLISLNRNKKVDKFPYYLEFLSISILIVAFILLIYKFPLSANPASLLFILFVTSAILLLYAYIFWIVEELGGLTAVFYPLIILGRYSLFLYVSHLVLLRGIFKILGLNNSLSVDQCILLMIGFLAIAIILGDVVYRRYRTISSLP